MNTFEPSSSRIGATCGQEIEHWMGMRFVSRWAGAADRIACPTLARTARFGPVACRSRGRNASGTCQPCAAHASARPSPDDYITANEPPRSSRAAASGGTSMNRLDGKVALISGAARGIGARNGSTDGRGRRRVVDRRHSGRGRPRNRGAIVRAGGKAALRHARRHQRSLVDGRRRRRRRALRQARHPGQQRRHLHRPRLRGGDARRLEQARRRQHDRRVPRHQDRRAGAARRRREQARTAAPSSTSPRSPASSARRSIRSIR